MSDDKKLTEEQVNEALKRLARAHVDGRMAYRILYFQQLNPEQKLAYVLETLIAQKKGELALMNLVVALAPAAAEYRKATQQVAAKMDDILKGKDT